MVTRIRKGARAHLYITEWMEHFGLSDEKVAGRLDVARETIWRWRTQQHRLNPDKIAALAHAIGVEPQDFWRPPTRPSVDAMFRDHPAEDVERAIRVLKALAKEEEAA